jgi:hypothetical protein
MKVTPVESWNSFLDTLARLNLLEHEDYYWSRFKFYNKIDLDRLSLKGLLNLQVHPNFGGLGFNTNSAISLTLS